MNDTPGRTLTGHLAVLNVRLEQLRLAIIARDWQEVEWQYDRVARSVDKLKRLEDA